MIFCLARRERHRTHRTPMKGARETNEIRTFGVISRQLNGGFHSFGPRIGHKGQRIFLERRDLTQFLAKLNPIFVIEIR